VIAASAFTGKADAGDARTPDVSGYGLAKKQETRIWKSNQALLPAADIRGDIRNESPQGTDDEMAML
jgi:hypothetical protein